MSIFKSTLKPYVIRQIKAREHLLGQEKRVDQFNSYVSGKSAWVRMTSLVDYKKSSDLAKKYILSGGTLLSGNFGASGSFASKLRGGVGMKGSSYGDPTISDPGRVYGLVPMPGIRKVEIANKGAYGSLLDASVEFIAHDQKQIDDLEILFLRPGFYVLLEFGHSQYLNSNPASGSNGDINVTEESIRDILQKNNYIKSFDSTTPTIDAFNLNGISEEAIYKKIHQLSERYCGNYGAMLGVIKNFSWKLQDDGSYLCTTNLISYGEVINSIKMDRLVKTDTTDEKSSYVTAFSKLLNNFKEETWISQPGQVGSNDPKNFFKEGVIYDQYVRSLNVLLTEQPDDSGNSNIGEKKYISLSQLFHTIDVFYNLYDRATTKKTLKFEIPHNQITGNRGNGLCLASRETVSADLENFIVINKNAKFITGNPDGFVFSKTSENINADFANAKDFLVEGEKGLGIIGNVYISLDYLINKVETIVGSTDKNKTLVDFLNLILKEMSRALGNINDFGIFIENNRAICIDKNYTELTRDTKKDSKAKINIMGKNSAVREQETTSRIFESQANMIAIAAQDRFNITTVQNSTYVKLRENLTNRLRTQTVDYQEAGNTDDIDNVEAQRQKFIRERIEELRVLKDYYGEFLSPSVDPETSNAVFTIKNKNDIKTTLQSYLNSLLVSIDTDTNYRTIIPIELSLKFDGIFGMVIGEIIRINDDVFPKLWRDSNIGFIITGINHIIEGSDWVTVLRFQTCLLDQDDLKNNLSFDYKKLITEGIKIQESIEMIAATEYVDRYNKLIKLLEDIFDPRKKSILVQYDTTKEIVENAYVNPILVKQDIDYTNYFIPLFDLGMYRSLFDKESFKELIESGLLTRDGILASIIPEKTDLKKVTYGLNYMGLSLSIFFRFKNGFLNFKPTEAGISNALKRIITSHKAFNELKTSKFDNTFRLSEKLLIAIEGLAFVSSKGVDRKVPLVSVVSTAVTLVNNLTNTTNSNNTNSANNRNSTETIFTYKDVIFQDKSIISENNRYKIRKEKPIFDNNSKFIGIGNSNEYFYFSIDNIYKTVIK